MKDKLKIVVTDDSAFMRRAVTTMLSAEVDFEVVGTGKNGKEAIELAKTLQPDVMTLDIEMPEMDGLTALRHIMREAPTNVVMVSSLTTAGSVASLQALRLGASDVIAKEHSQMSLTVTNMREKLVATVRSLGHNNRFKKTRAVPKPQAAKIATQIPDYRGRSFDLICVGSSTGGPPVLETILGQLPSALRTPIVIAQHMPRVFTESMAERLDQICKLTVVHAEDGTPIESGHVYIAPGGQHIKVRKKGLRGYRIEVGPEPTSAVYKPSVDELLSTAAATSGKRTLAVVLTGIGEDGKHGAMALREHDAPILAQNEASCVVYGMPRAVTEAGLIDASLTPEDIGQCLVRMATGAAAA